MTDGTYSDDFAQNFSFAVSRSTPTLVLQTFLEGEVIDPSGDPGVWLGDPIPYLMLARFNRQASEIPQDVRYAGFTGPLFVNDNGQSAFRAVLGGGDVTTDNDSALYVTNASGAHFAMREGAPRQIPTPRSVNSSSEVWTTRAGRHFAPGYNHLPRARASFARPTLAIAN